MIFATANKIPAFLMEKLDLLHQLLHERKNEYEAFAGKVGNKQLKHTVLSLAQETNQYAHELGRHIESMGGPVVIDESFLKPTFTITELADDEDAIMRSCEVSETKMISAYRTLLNEPFMHDSLRKLIRNQLNGLTYAFMQLRLLNTSFHR